MHVVLPHIRVDDWVFGVSSVSKDGFESPVASAVPGGAFNPYISSGEEVGSFAMAGGWTRDGAVENRSRIR